MQLVGTDEVLGLLRDGAVGLGGQQLGRDGRVQHVEQDARERGGARRVRHVAHEVAHEGLGHAGVDAVHTHVVAVVGGPAQRELGQVARADHEAALLIGDIHQDLCTLAGLAVLVGHVAHRLVVADVGEVLAHGVPDGNLAQLGAQGVGQVLRVGVRALRRAEARHRDGQDALAVQPYQVEGARDHEQRQRGVQTARDAHHHVGRAGVRQALGQTVCLNREHVFAALGTRRRVVGHEGMRVHVAREQRLCARARRLEREGGVGVAQLVDRRGTGLVGGHALALGAQHADVDLGGRATLVKGRTLGEHGAVLGDHVVRAEDDVLRRLALPRARVDIGADQTGGLARHEAAAVGRLADQGVGGREVDDHRGAGLRVGDRGRRGHPEVFADLGRDLELGQRGAAEDLPRAKGHVVHVRERQVDRDRVERAARKVTTLVKLVVGGQVELGHDAQHLASRRGDRAVVELVVHADRRAEEEQHVVVSRRADDGTDRALRGVEQRLLPEEVLAGVGGHAELGQHDELGVVVLVRTPHLLQDGLGVEVHVGHAHLRRARRDLYEAVPHEVLPSSPVPPWRRIREDGRWKSSVMRLSYRRQASHARMRRTMTSCHVTIPRGDSPPSPVTM